MAPTSHVCDICHKTLGNSNTFRQHVRDVHTGVRHKCPKCNKEFARERTLRSHLNSHGDGHVIAKFSCPDCSASFAWEHHLRVHIKAKHAEGNVTARFSCPQCPASFSWMSSLRGHINGMHAGQATCRVCGQTYSTVPNLNKHMRKDHAPSARCECPHPGCAEKFQRIVEVKKHMKSAHHDHAEGCRCCTIEARARRVVGEMVLVNFMQATGELSCNENDCEFTTKCIRGMDLHKSRDHGHELTLLCLFCSPRRQWFSERKFLHDHLERIHNGKRPYLCECGYVSPRAFDDLRHRAACEKGKGFGNRKTKRHVNEQIELNITGESVFSKYTFSERIVAAGAYGTVYIATKTGGSSAEKFAIKEVGLKAEGNIALEHTAKARTEAGTMLRFHHKNINTCVEVFDCLSRPDYGLQRPAFYIVMSLHLPGSLAKVKMVMGKAKRFRQEHLTYIMQQGAAGLVELHRQLVIHRDLTAANIFLNNRAEVLIGDFGSCSNTGPMAFTNTGTEYTKPAEQGLATKGPERRGYTQTVDCYSLASTVVDSAVSQLPQEFEDLEKKDSDDFAATALEKVMGQVLGGFSQPFQAVLRACLGKSNTRPTAIELLETDVIRKAMKEPLRIYVEECLSAMKERRMI